MAHLKAVSFFRPCMCSTMFAAAVLGGAVLALLGALRYEPTLAASSNNGRVDFDRDGLTDLQELVVGTLPDRVDTDGDNRSEERRVGKECRL